jgi:hypothetical protein
LCSTTFTKGDKLEAARQKIFCPKRGHLDFWQSAFSLHLQQPCGLCLLLRTNELLSYMQPDPNPD